VRDKKKGEKYHPEVLSNGDTLKQLLVRCRLLLYKYEENWSEKQKQRAALLFSKYPLLEKASRTCGIIRFRNIYQNTHQENAKKQFVDWINEIQKTEISEFITAANSIPHVRDHLETILNFFKHRNTNANAESFNSKIKLFRANQRAVKDINFFLFRLEKLFA